MMAESDEEFVSLFAKSATEMIGVVVTEWKGKPRLDIRVYVQAVGEDSLVPTQKGISLDFEKYPMLLSGVRALGEVMGNEKLVATIPKSKREELRIGVNMYKGNPLLYMRTFLLFNATDTEWKPTQKGISLRVDLYPKLLEAVEALGPAIEQANRLA
jgi:hypothetical protein